MLKVDRLGDFASDGGDWAGPGKSADDQQVNHQERLLVYRQKNVESVTTSLSH